MTNLSQINSNSETNIILRSEEAQEIISKRPPAIIRWGSSIFVLVLLICLFLSYLIRYPDIVSVPFVLSSANAPKSIHAKTTGKLVKLLVKENQEVSENTHLAFLESTAKHEQVLALENELEDFRTNEGFITPPPKGRAVKF